MVILRQKILPFSARGSPSNDVHETSSDRLALTLLNTYIYIYMCVCECVCVCVPRV